MDINETAVDPTHEDPQPASPLGPIFEELKPERVQEELKTMPGWQLAASGKALERVAAGGQVRVVLSANGCGGLTQAVIDLARHLG